MRRRALAYKKAISTPTIYDDAVGAYSLRKFFSWSNAVLKIRRSSDNATAYVFFDGASSQDTISTSSYISTSSNTTPSATTLSTWLSTDNAFVEEHFFQTPDDTINTDFIVKQTTTTKQPQFATSGAINTYNSNIEYTFDGTNDVLTNILGLPELDYDQEFTVLSVSRHNVDAGRGTLFNTGVVSGAYFAIFNDRRTNKDQILLTGGSLKAATLLAQQNSATQRLQTSIHNSTNIISYFNGTIQQTTAHSSEAYSNIRCTIGEWGTGKIYLNGSAQELIFFPSDKTSDLSELHSDINSYYSIY